MLSTADFLVIAKWFGITTLAFGALMLLSFAFKWGFRFRLVGVTGFMGVLTGGLFALSLGPIVPTSVPGAVRYVTVFDSGATQAVIVVPATITETELDATLKQAASNLFSPGRLGRGGDRQLTILARTVLHPEEGVSQPLVLGQIKRSLRDRTDENLDVTIYSDRLAAIPPAPSTGS
ncbi:MAG: hypothetical protein EA367_11620 [Leptolyngbya sp. DLM2.Bin15]|nr:MAG: hypothetical protein EA367_11620 [Leptolyngbya sp. DLM2.Bin15]